MEASNTKVKALLREDKQSEAAREFQTKFTPAVRELYSKAASTYPPRFAKVNDWCSWTKGLYIGTIKTGKALESGSADEAEKMLGLLRRHFHAMYKEAGFAKCDGFVCPSEQK